MLSALAFCLELLTQAFLLTVSWMGTSPLAILVSVVIVPIPILIRKWVKQGWHGLRVHIFENVRDTVVYTALIWSLFIGFNLFVTIPGRIRAKADQIPSPLVVHPSPPDWAHKFERNPALARPRSHIHVTAVDLVSASPGGVIKVRTHFQNIGDAEITQLRNYIVMAIRPFSEDLKVQIETEDSLFEEVKKAAKKLPIAPNQIPGHSIVLNSDNSGTSRLPPELLGKVEAGSFAIYLIGRIMYRDSSKLRHADYCYWTKGDVNGMKLCFAHNQEP